MNKVTLESIKEINQIRRQGTQTLEFLSGLFISSTLYQSFLFFIEASCHLGYSYLSISFPDFICFFTEFESTDILVLLPLIFPDPLRAV